MGMKGIAIERWPSDRTAPIRKWLLENMGPESATTWYVEYDYDLFTLVMNEEIYVIYKLRWPQ